MDNKELYSKFCESNYVPVYSKPWWLDAICGPVNWDVWLYIKGDSVLAAMPYYFEMRGNYKYITKAPLTQNNGIIFTEDENRKKVKQAKFEEEVISEACDYIAGMGLDVYEQQYQHTFRNWLPFSWRGYSCMLRYTYIIEDTSDMTAVEAEFTQDCKRNINRGNKAVKISSDIDYKEFYRLHESVFAKQGLKCPFSFELWERLYKAAKEHDSCEMYCGIDEESNVHALLFLIWDDRYVYHLLGGAMPEFTNTQAYAALTYYGINKAHEMKLGYDFEGSMIERISKSFRRYGGDPMPYFRIRKIFNPEIIQLEADQQIKKLKSEQESSL